MRGRGNKLDVRPNWKEQPTDESLTGKCSVNGALSCRYHSQAANHRGTVEAANANEVIKIAVETERQNRIAVQKVSKGKDERPPAEFSTRIEL